MIDTERTIQAVPQRSDNLFNDLFTVVNKRNGFSTSKLPVIPIYFYRYIGVGEETGSYEEKLCQLDKGLQSLGKAYLKIVSSLPMVQNPELIVKTQSIWSQFTSLEGMQSLYSKVEKAEVFPRLQDHILNATMKRSFFYIVDLCLKNSANASPTIMKNFMVKQLSWIYHYLPPLVQDLDYMATHRQEIHNPKVLFYGDIKPHEIYFLIFLSQMGCDVLYVHPCSEGAFAEIDSKEEYSKQMRLSQVRPLKEFPYVPPTLQRNTPQKPPSPDVPSAHPVSKVDLKRRKPKRGQEGQRLGREERNGQRQEKALEELAALSNSTVMIRVYDRNGQVIAGGSGVVIDHQGLIVTNYHVIEGGMYFGIIFEALGEGCQYETYTVINKDIKRDLALLKINQRTVPLKIGTSEQVTRGQKVVAIGSPLGLMNTFSDGIISGYRKNEVYDFLQTTAPVSPGSSGGALLNMYGELVGVTTAIFIDGQNLNLAVPSQYVQQLYDDKATRMNKDILDNFYCFRYNDFRMEFDGFFSGGYSDGHKISLYQCRYDRADLSPMLADRGFVDAIENYYIENIKKIALQYGIPRYDFELGSGKHVFKYRYDNRMITYRCWDSIR